MLYVHYRNYKGVIEDYENVFHSILLKEFEHEYNESKSSVAMELHVFENDLKDRIVKDQTAPPDE